MNTSSYTPPDVGAVAGLEFLCTEISCSETKICRAKLIFVAVALLCGVEGVGVATTKFAECAVSYN